MWGDPEYEESFWKEVFSNMTLVDVSQEGAHPTSEHWGGRDLNFLRGGSSWLVAFGFESIWARLIATLARQHWSSEYSLEGSQLMIWVSHAGIQSESCSTEYVSSLSVLWPVLTIYQHLGSLQYRAGVIFICFQRPHEACVLYSSADALETGQYAVMVMLFCASKNIPCHTYFSYSSST